MKTKYLIIIILIILLLGFLVGAYFIISYCIFKYIKKYNNENITITAHADCEGNKPNSIESLECGYKSGAQILEFDLFFDKNGVPYLSHDELKGNEIKLEEAFQFFAANQDVKGNIDVKKVDNMAEVFNLIKFYNLINRVFFTGVTEEFVEAVRNGCPGIPYYLNYKPNFGKINSQNYIKELVKKVKEYGAIGINMPHYYLSKKLVKIFHEESLFVSVWTVNQGYFMQRAIFYGPDNITTKHPNKLLKLIE